MNYKIIESNIIHKGKVFDLRIDNIVYDSGSSNSQRWSSCSTSIR
jgi:hypothetical protein